MTFQETGPELLSSIGDCRSGACLRLMVGTETTAVASLETTHWYEPFWKPPLDPLSTHRLLCWIPQESNQQDGNTDPPNIRQASHRSPEHNPAHQSDQTQLTHQYTRTSPSHQEAYISHLRQTQGCLSRQQTAEDKADSRNKNYNLQPVGLKPNSQKVREQEGIWPR